MIPSSAPLQVTSVTVIVYVKLDFAPALEKVLYPNPPGLKYFFVISFLKINRPSSIVNDKFSDSAKFHSLT